MIDSVQLRQFRNHDQLAATFQPGTNLIVGPNGSGKTSILEAMYATATGASWRGSTADLVQDSGDWAAAEFAIGDDSYKLQLDGREGPLSKTRLINDESKRTGFPSLLLLEPTAIELVVGGPRRRREWLDDVLVRTQPDYQRTLKQYSRALSQRNALLKKEIRNPDQLFVWNIKLAELGAKLATQRQQLIEDAHGEVNRLFAAVAGYSKGLHVSYQPKFDPVDYSQQFMNYLEANLERDIAIGFTPAGPHREDITLRVDGGAASDHLSRGEQMILAFSLIYAQAQRLKPAAVLLDDFTSDLDNTKSINLIATINQQCIVASVNAQLADAPVAVKF